MFIEIDSLDLIRTSIAEFCMYIAVEFVLNSNVRSCLMTRFLPLYLKSKACM